MRWLVSVAYGAGKHLQTRRSWGNPAASSLADLGSNFTVVRQMQLAPIAKLILISLAISAALPMVPVVLYVTPGWAGPGLLNMLA